MAMCEAVSVKDAWMKTSSNSVYIVPRLCPYSLVLTWKFMLLCRSPGKCIKEQRRRVTLEGKKIMLLSVQKSEQKQIIVSFILATVL